MSSSYQFSQEHNFQSLLWDAAGAIFSAVSVVYSWLPTIWAVIQALGFALALTSLIVGAVVIVAVIPPVFWLGLTIIALFAVVTYPRSKAVQA